VKVAAHASATGAISTVVDLGIDTIEHGYNMNDDALLARMAKKGVIWVPTLSVYHALGMKERLSQVQETVCVTLSYRPSSTRP
jgi:imidazolonepropionase-like amidohydrolase